MPELDPSLREAVLFVNANARRGERWFELAQQGLKARGIQLQQTELCRDKATMLRNVRDALDRECPLIVLGGGDGTFGSVDHDFAHRSSVLGVLPLGTGNAFARDLGIRTQVDHACDVIAYGKTSRVDLGLVGDQHFLNVATVGASTMIARRLNRRLKKVFGPIAYLISVYQSLRDVRPFDVRLQLEDERAEFRSLQVVLGNGRFHAGPYLLATDAKLTNEKLLIYALASDRRSALFRLALAVQLGRHVDLHDVKVWRSKKGRLETGEPRTVTVDGELILRTPFDFGVDPGSLQVRTPLEFDETP